MLVQFTWWKDVEQLNYFIDLILKGIDGSGHLDVIHQSLLYGLAPADLELRDHVVLVLLSVHVGLVIPALAP